MLLSLTGLGPAKAGQALSLADFVELATRCAPDVAAATLAAIARTESHLQPYAVHDNSSGLSAAAASAEAAVNIASRLIAAGHSIDLGLMQVDSANLRGLGMTVSDGFDACQSIRAGAAILADGYRSGGTHAQQQAALRVALSRYDTGDSKRGFANGYVRKVEISAQQVVPAIDLAFDNAAPRPAEAAPAPIASRREGSERAAGINLPFSWLVWSADSQLGKSADISSAAVGSNDAGNEIMADGGSGVSAAVAYDNGPTQRK